jgi:hypothetical protein
VSADVSARRRKEHAIANPYHETCKGYAITCSTIDFFGSCWAMEDFQGGFGFAGPRTWTKVWHRVMGPSLQASSSARYFSTASLSYYHKNWKTTLIRCYCIPKNLRVLVVRTPPSWAIAKRLSAKILFTKEALRHLRLSWCSRRMSVDVVSRMTLLHRILWEQFAPRANTQKAGKREVVRG